MINLENSARFLRSGLIGGDLRLGQITYAYKYPPVFPAGTVLHQTSYHDNSSANKNNPDPGNWAGGGERTVDEMSIAHIDFIYLTDEDYQAAIKKQPSSTNQQQQ